MNGCEADRIAYATDGLHRRWVAVDDVPGADIVSSVTRRWWQRHELYRHFTMVADPPEVSVVR
jgi:hypothetical protein